MTLKEEQNKKGADREKKTEKKEYFTYKQPEIDMSIYREELDRMAEVVRDFENNFKADETIDVQLNGLYDKLKEAGSDKIIKYIEECVENSGIQSNFVIEDGISK